MIGAGGAIGAATLSEVFLVGFFDLRLFCPEGDCEGASPMGGVCATTRGHRVTRVPAALTVIARRTATWQRVTLRVAGDIILQFIVGSEESQRVGERKAVAVEGPRSH